MDELEEAVVEVVDSISNLADLAPLPDSLSVILGKAVDELALYLKELTK